LPKETGKNLSMDGNSMFGAPRLEWGAWRKTEHCRQGGGRASALGGLVER